LDRFFGSSAERQQLSKVDAGAAELISTGCPPRASLLPFKSRDVGTSRQQCLGRTYTDCRCARKGFGGGTGLDGG
jgi:hypothetical protein